MSMKGLQELYKTISNVKSSTNIQYKEPTEKNKYMIELNRQIDDETNKRLKLEKEIKKLKLIMKVRFAD